MASRSRRTTSGSSTMKPSASSKTTRAPLLCSQPQRKKAMPFAHYNLARMHENGHGIQQDLRLSLRHYTSAARAGHSGSQLRLANALFAGDGTHRSSQEAEEWLRKAANGRYAHAQYALAWRLLHGRGVPADPREAIKWFKRASANGVAAATNWIGTAYKRGHGVTKNLSTAAKVVSSSGSSWRSTWSDKPRNCSMQRDQESPPIIAKPLTS